nr:hypothetical protein Itr_chr01CG07670 [Ipomoea trifida]GMC71001.1 hypothetical protein Iba_scaffold61481CG0010 [Ipomoea batatas]GLL21581.1 hypothetical protein Itr_chr03CG05140 [Ipomoea trifida]GMC74673.1 hypothetical protein Iba_scaffold34185CG0010 [Ipomoea batatas]GMD93516.1 hypothetical protein Iba_chr14fCG8200 [Ipomoea batatas]
MRKATFSESGNTTQGDKSTTSWPWKFPGSIFIVRLDVIFPCGVKWDAKDTKVNRRISSYPLTRNSSSSSLSRPDGVPGDRVNLEPIWLSSKV